MYIRNVCLSIYPIDLSMLYCNITNNRIRTWAVHLSNDVHKITSFQRLRIEIVIYGL